jgi:DNA-directed RNA polymerase subunit RPC12/RpoP
MKEKPIIEKWKCHRCRKRILVKYFGQYEDLKVFTNGKIVKWKKKEFMVCSACYEQITGVAPSKRRLFFNKK